MPRDYYHCLFRFRGSERYLIWFTDEQDGVFVDAHFRVPTFDSAEALEQAFPSLVGDKLVYEEPTLHDLDLVESRCRSVQPLEVDCQHFLTVWNLLVDVARCVGRPGNDYLESDAALDSEYDKLFFGSNLPAVTPPGEHYTPSWNKAELDAMRRHLLLGLELFESSIYNHDHGSERPQTP